MNKKGFTLMELLAVIVILAIIVLIATPIILNIIENSKESATIRGAEYYLNAVELAVARNRLDNIKLEGPYNILTNGNICNQNDITNEVCNEGKEITIEVSGEIPDSGTVTITNGKIVDINLTYDGKTVVKEGNKLVIAGESNNNNDNNDDDDDNNDNDTNTDNNIPAPVSFEADEWSTIIANVKAGNLSKYNVGDTKEIELKGYENGETDENGKQIKTYTVRIANKTTNDEEGVCTNSNYSQTACGFVIEFVDIITNAQMNSYYPANGGWPASLMRTYVNETIYNALPLEIKDNIIDTRVVSGYEYNKSENYTSPDKLYLLSTKEIYGKAVGTDKVSSETRQLDYYLNLGLTISSSDKSVAIKYLNGSATAWWLRSANYSRTSYGFNYVRRFGDSATQSSDVDFGIAPAFRLGKIEEN